jgi:arabinoxylan arabinofuranohydrolase
MNYVWYNKNMQIYSERRAFMKKLPAILFAAAAAMVMCSCGDADISSVTMEGEKIKSASKGVKITAVTDNITKTTGNPLISNIFCADPTAVEYEGRLYVYGTNDQQQYEAVGAEGSNTYEHIKSLVMLSTDDMVNWTYHGTIDVGEISPWAIASWAPSVVSIITPTAFSQNTILRKSLRITS